jgi:formylglycine-generating enzyme required for sulfatase activity
MWASIQRLEDLAMNVLVNLYDENKPLEKYRPRAKGGEAPKWTLVVEGFWSESIYHSGYHAYSVCQSKKGCWVLNQCKRNGCLDHVTEGHVKRGALNDDQSQAIHNFGSLKKAQEWEFNMICAVWLDPPEGLTAEGAGRQLYREFVEQGGTRIEDWFDEYEEEEDDDEEYEDEDEEQAEYKDDVPTPVLAEPPGTITNSIGMKLVPIPAGTFLMGSEYAQQHEVTLTKDFYLGITQVTQAQYEEVMGENPSRFQADKVSGRDSSEFPVEQVSWEDALKFCEKLSSLPDEKAAGRVYRFPTEAEWEYACRAGTSTAYCFGDDEESLSDYAWYHGNSGKRPHPVALKKPNAWGLYDMCGNVYEWCSDWFGDYPKGAVSDPAGPKGGVYRVYRGGSWFDGAAYCRSSYRRGGYPAHRNLNFGFRVALSLSSEIPK